MQPYLFPYIGYFQLLRASDIFVVLDDVQYMKGGWINRNRILLDGRPHWLTLPVEKAPIQLAINQRDYVAGDAGRAGILNALRSAYRKAPFRSQVMPLVEEILAFDGNNVARFNRNAIELIAGRLGIAAKVISASDLAVEGLSGPARVIEICRRLGAHSYVNAIGGTGLYDKGAFADNGVELGFLKATPTPYSQLGAEFVPFLSVIDVLMFNPIEAAHGLLDQYELV